MTKIIVGRLHIAWIKLGTSGHSGIWQGQAVMQGWACVNQESIKSLP